MLAACSRRTGDRHSVGIDLEREGALGSHHGIASVACHDCECVVVRENRLATEKSRCGIQRETAWQCAACFQCESVRRLAALDFENLRVVIQLLAVWKLLWSDPLHRVTLCNRDGEIRGGVARVSICYFHYNRGVTGRCGEVAGDDTGAGVDRKGRWQCG